MGGVRILPFAIWLGGGVSALWKGMGVGWCGMAYVCVMSQVRFCLEGALSRSFSSEVLRFSKGPKMMSSQFRICQLACG